ncbi:MAG: SusC/RagA family TonB-linked outer membrane protein, partial [Ferruginibacter sp.]
WGDQQFTPVFYLSPTVSVLKNNFGKSNNETYNWNIENTLQYHRNFGPHDFKVLLGQGAYVENNGGGSSVTLFDLPITRFEDASFNFDIPQANRTSGSYDFTNHKLSSLFAKLDYNYNERYLFTGIVRRDGSSRFGTNNKFGVFSSGSVGWNVYKESFWVDNKVIKSLKLRAGYGTVGNDAISDFGYLSTVGGGFNYTLGNQGIITTGYAPTSLDNPDLKWEETSQLNIGMDAALFKNFNLSIDVYNKKTSGILRSIHVPGYVGVSNDPVGNIASMENKGLEVELGYRKTFGKVGFSASGNVAYLKNKVTYVNSDAESIDGGAAFQSMGPVTRIQVGQSFNSFYGFQTAGIFQNWAEISAYSKSGTMIQPNAQPGDFRWQDTDGDGKITGADKVFLGSNIPKVTYGLTLNLDFMGFDLMAFGQGAAGNKIFQGLRRLDIQNGNYQTKAMSRWTGEGTSNDYPRLTTNDLNGNFGNMSNFYLEKGDYFRLKILQLGYTLQSYKFLQKVGATKVRFYLTGENILTLTNYTGYDPEIGGGVFGIDKGYYPQARSFLAGVQLQF